MKLSRLIPPALIIVFLVFVPLVHAVDPGSFYVVSNTSWKASDTFSPDWFSPSFDDSGWEQAAAPSYGVCSLSLLPEIPVYPSGMQMMWSQHPVEHGTVYFRKTFSITQPSTGIFQGVFDDDGDIYVNGQLAYSDHDGTVAGTGLVTADFSQYLQVGQNVIAIAGVDSFGLCQDVQFELAVTPQTPAAVPEFGLIPGALALAGSVFGFLKLRGRVS